MMGSGSADGATTDPLLQLLALTVSEVDVKLFTSIMS